MILRLPKELLVARLPLKPVPRSNNHEEMREPIKSPARPALINANPAYNSESYGSGLSNNVYNVWRFSFSLISAGFQRASSLRVVCIAATS